MEKKGRMYFLFCFLITPPSLKLSEDKKKAVSRVQETAGISGYFFLTRDPLLEEDPLEDVFPEEPLREEPDRVIVPLGLLEDEPDERELTLLEETAVLEPL